MSRSKPKTTRPLAPYESTLKIQSGSKIVNDTYARITESLVSSEAFKDLSSSQQILYIFMREQDMGKRKPNRDYDEESPIWDLVKSDQCFYFPFHTAKRYSKRYEKNSSRLYDDIDELIEHGFVEKVVNGHNTRKMNVYRYSDKWQQWEKFPP